MANRPTRYTYIGKRNKKINLAPALTGGIGGGITGGYSTDAVQPTDESILEEGTTDVAPLGTTTSYTPYSVNHPWLDALFNGGRGAASANAYNQAYGADQMHNQQATDRLLLENELATKRQQDAEDTRYNDENTLRDDDVERKNKEADDNTVRLGQALQMAEQDKRTRALGLEPSYTARTLGMVAPVLYGKNLETSGLDTAQNINTAAEAASPLIPSLTKANQLASIAKANLNTTQDTGTNDYITGHPDEFNSSIGAELAKQGIANSHTKAVADALGDKNSRLINLGTHQNGNTMVTQLYHPDDQTLTEIERGLDNDPNSPTYGIKPVFNVNTYDVGNKAGIVSKDGSNVGNKNLITLTRGKGGKSNGMPSNTGVDDAMLDAYNAANPPGKKKKNNSLNLTMPFTGGAVYQSPF